MCLVLQGVWYFESRTAAGHLKNTTFVTRRSRMTEVHHEDWDQQMDRCALAAKHCCSWCIVQLGGMCRRSGIDTWR